MSEKSDTRDSRGEGELRGAVIAGKAPWLVIGAMTVLVASLWGFAGIWYRTPSTEDGFLWFAERSDVEGWEYTAEPVDSRAERLLVADQLFCGGFTTTKGDKVATFTAKRFEAKRNDLGLFVHTPDRCWTEAGWKVEVVQPDHVEVDIHGASVVFERRVFNFRGQRELVYFGGMIGGRPVPYRLDHYESVAQRHAAKDAKGSTSASLRASDSLFWKRVWDAFATKSPLFGPKHFIRVSTPVLTAGLEAEDRLLVEFLREFLEPSDFGEEHENWLASRSDDEQTSE